MCRFPIAGRQRQFYWIYAWINYSNIKFLQDCFLHIEFVKHLYLSRNSTLYIGNLIWIRKLNLQKPFQNTSKYQPVITIARAKHVEDRSYYFIPIFGSNNNSTAKPLQHIIYPQLYTKLSCILETLNCNMQKTQQFTQD